LLHTLPLVLTYCFRPLCYCDILNCRTASDLEERGYISREQKGIMKDLIISGDLAVQQALDKLAHARDESDLQALCKTIGNRRGSIDLLENMDLDLAFLGHDDREGGVGDVFFGQSTDFADEDGISMSMEAIRQMRRSSFDSNSGFRGFDDLLAHNPVSKVVTGIADRSGSITSSSIFGNGNNEDVLLQSFHTNIFDLQGHVEMSAYENVAKSLSVAKNPNRNNGVRKGYAPMIAPKVDISNRNIHNTSATMGSGSAGMSHTTTNTGKSDGAMSSVVHKASPAFHHATSTSASPHPPTTGSQQHGDASSFSSELPDVPLTTTTLLHPTVWAKRAEGEEVKLYIGAYSPEQRKSRIERFIEKRSRRVWTKKVKYDVRKNFADSRLRVKGRFVKKEDEEIMRELMTI
jgi:hypothetical protein